MTPLSFVYFVTFVVRLFPVNLGRAAKNNVFIRQSGSSLAVIWLGWVQTFYDAVVY